MADKPTTPTQRIAFVPNPQAKREPAGGTRPACAGQCENCPNRRRPRGTG